MKPATRLRIVDFLRKQQTASAQELSRLFGMTSANIRHHLIVLEADDIVEVISRRREGKGRPENIYGLSRRVRGDGLSDLSGALLDEWLDRYTNDERAAQLRSLAKRLGAGFSGARAGPLPKKLTDMVHFLNTLHYQPHWEAGAYGAKLVFGQCPYLAIIENHPELCMLDCYLIEGCIGKRILQFTKLEPQISGLKHCTFLVAG